VVLARMSFWNFKKGKREEAFSELDRILNTLAQEAEGFRGYMSLLSYEDPDALTVLTLWQDEDSMKKSEKGVFAQAIKKVQDLLENPPCTDNYRVYSTQLFQRPQ
jgi:heme-degrading monooxygenase HmoA